MNKVLVIGSGGREHALAWRLSLSSTVEHVYVAPGNPGCETEKHIENVAIATNDYDALIAFSKNQKIDLVVVGPEQPLCDGLVDRMKQEGIKCFGPSASAAQLEGSKVFSKNFLRKYSIPTANYESFTEVVPALNYASKQKYPLVIKADGLAAGKGVVIAHSVENAQKTIKNMLAGNAFGEAGHRIIIEEFLAGEEASFIVVVDGENFIPMATSQDHKARDVGDKGPNTGGMGAYSPAPCVTEEVFGKAVERVIKPTIQGMIKEGSPFVGFLYAGLMIDKDNNPKVLEFNVRFGDPETQPIMMRLKSNLDEICLKAIEGNLKGFAVDWDSRSALGVVLAEQGYPDKYSTGSIVDGLQANGNYKVFHAGTKINNSNLVTNGGRVFCVCSIADSLLEARNQAYQGAKKVNWSNKYFRDDIGYKAL